MTLKVGDCFCSHPPEIVLKKFAFLQVFFLNIEPQLFSTSLCLYVISCLCILAATRYLVKKWSRLSLENLSFSIIHRMKSKHISTAIIACLSLVPIYLSCFSRNCPKSGPPRSVNKRYQVCCISVPRVTNNTLNRGGRLIQVQ